MSTLVHDNSQKISTPELDLFSVPPTAVGIVSSRYVECPLVNSINNTGPLEWRYTMQKNFVNLKKSYVRFVLSIRDAKGERLVLEEDEEEDAIYPISFINAIARTLVRQYLVTLSGQLIEDSGGSCNHAYRAFIETELTTDRETRNVNLSAAGYAFDEEPGKETSSGHVTRQGFVNQGQSYEVMSTLNLNLFNQEKLLIPFIDLKIQAMINSAPFVIESFEVEADATKYTFEIEEATLFINECEVEPSAAAEIERMLTVSPAIYPFTSVQMRAFFISPGRLHSPENKLHTRIPKRVIVCLTGQDNFNGTYKTTPFLFEPFSATEVTLNVAGKTIPARSMPLDFDNGTKIMPAYTQMHEALGFARSHFNNGITRELFAKYYTFFCFEVSPYLDANTLDLIQLGAVSLQISLAKPSPGIYAIVYSEFDSILRIDSHRQVYLDTML